MPEKACQIPDMTREITAIDRQDDPFLSLNLRHLRAFTVVAKAGTIAAAAEQLFRVASAVTRAITELEAALGRPLFDRRAREMVLNPYGKLVLRRALRVEAELGQARRQLMTWVDAHKDVGGLFASLPNGRRLAVMASLVEMRNMQVVARAFGITQPAVSAALRDLEGHLGTRLFERRGRTLLPTPAGEILAFHFRRVLAELRHIGADLAASEGMLQGSVIVGALPLGRTRVLPLAITQLLRQHPGLRVSSVESPYESLAASLRNGEVDFIFGALRNSADAEGLEQETLFQDRLAVVARSGHPLTRTREITFESLRQARWALSRRGSPARELLERFFDAARQTPPSPAVETGDLALLRGLLLESDLITAISAHQLRYEIRDGSLEILDFPLDDTRRDIGLSQRVDALPSPGARALMQALREVVEQSEDFLDTDARSCG